MCTKPQQKYIRLRLVWYPRCIPKDSSSVSAHSFLQHLHINGILFPLSRAYIHIRPRKVLIFTSRLRRNWRHIDRVVFLRGLMKWSGQICLKLTQIAAHGNSRLDQTGCGSSSGLQRLLLPKQEQATVMTWLKYQRFHRVTHAQRPEVKPLLTLAFHALLHNLCTAAEPEGWSATSYNVPSAREWLNCVCVFFLICASCYPTLSPAVLTGVTLFLFTLSLLPESANLIRLKALVLLSLPSVFRMRAFPNYSSPYRSGRRGRLGFCCSYQNANAFERKH